MSDEVAELPGATYNIIVCEEADNNAGVLNDLGGASQVGVKIEVDSAAKIEDVRILPKFPFKKGIYIFQNKSTSEIPYVGSGGFRKQTLEERVRQHFHQKDGGADFRKRWAKYHCRCEVNCFGKSKDCFECYKKLIDNSMIVLLSICDEVSALSLEHALGCCLRSKYSSH